MNADNLPLPLRWPVLATLGIALLPLLLQLPHLLAILVAASWLLISGASLRWSLPSVLRLLLVVLVLATIAQQMGLRPGRDTGCALLAAMLAIKGSELRNLRDARSAIGFALFAPFAAFLLDQGPLSLLLGLLAVLAALANLARLARWSVGLPSQAALPQLCQVMLLLLLALPLLRAMLAERTYGAAANCDACVYWASLGNDGWLAGIGILFLAAGLALPSRWLRMALAAPRIL